MTPAHSPKATLSLDFYLHGMLILTLDTMLFFGQVIHTVLVALHCMPVMLMHFSEHYLVPVERQMLPKML